MEREMSQSPRTFAKLLSREGKQASGTASCQPPCKALTSLHTPQPECHCWHTSLNALHTQSPKPNPRNTANPKSPPPQPHYNTTTPSATPGRLGSGSRSSNPHNTNNLGARARQQFTETRTSNLRTGTSQVSWNQDSFVLSLNIVTKETSRWLSSQKRAAQHLTLFSAKAGRLYTAQT